MPIVRRLVSEWVDCKGLHYFLSRFGPISFEPDASVATCPTALIRAFTLDSTKWLKTILASFIAKNTPRPAQQKWLKIC
jgi:hypothetical protein